MQEISIDDFSISPQDKTIKLDVNSNDQEFININSNHTGKLFNHENLVDSIIIPNDNPIYNTEKPGSPVDRYGSSSGSNNWGFNSRAIIENSSVLIKSIVENISLMYSSEQEILTKNDCLKEVYKWNYPKFNKDNLYSKKGEEIMDFNIDQLFGNYTQDNYITEM